MRIRGLKRLKRATCLFVVNKLLAGPKCFGAKRRLLCWADYSIGNNTKVVAPFFSTAIISIGDNCWIGKNFKCNGNGVVKIGNNCDIGPEVTFQTGGHLIGDEYRRAGKGVKYSQQVGDGTWIGGRSTIIGDTNIGRGCVIAGCACVIKSVSDNKMVGGIPAKEIRNLSDDD